MHFRLMHSNMYLAGLNVHLVSTLQPESIYTSYKYTLFVWRVFVCLYPINVTTDFRSCPNFVWDFTCPRKGLQIDIENRIYIRGEFNESLGMNFFGGVGWRVCDTSSCQISEVKHTCPQPVSGLVSRLVFMGSIPVLRTNLWFQ